MTTNKTHQWDVASRMGSLLHQQNFVPPLAACKKTKKVPLAPKSPEVRNLGKERKEQENRLRRLAADRAAKEQGYLKKRPPHQILNNEQKDYVGVKGTSSYQAMTGKALVTPTSFYTKIPKSLTLNEAEDLLSKQRKEYVDFRKNPFKKRAQNTGGRGAKIHYAYNNKGELVERKWNDIFADPHENYSGINTTTAYKTMAAKMPGMSKAYL
jgi:hypothetical protein